jgi:hypothetical protein
MDGEDVLLRSPIVGDWMLAAAMTHCDLCYDDGAGASVELTW